MSKNASHWPLSIMSCLAALGNVVIPLVLVRNLSTEDVGVYKIFFLYLMLSPLISLTSGLVNGFAYWSGQKDERLSAVQTSSLIAILTAAALSIFALLSVPILSSTLNWPANICIIFSLSLFSSILHNYYEELAIAHGNVMEGATFYAAFEIARASSIACVAFFTNSLVAILLTHVLLSSFKVLIGIFLAIERKYIGRQVSWSAFGKVVNYALPVSTAWLFGVFINHADQFILSIFIPAEHFAFYAIGCLVVPPLLIYEHSVTRVLIPKLSDAFSKKQDAYACNLYAESINHLALLIVPASIGLFIYAEPIIKLLFTESYTASTPYLRLFAFSYLALIIPFDSVARAKGQSMWILKYFTGFSILSLALTILGIDAFGAMGALAALLISKFLMRLYTIYYIQQEYNWSLHEILPIDKITKYTITSLTLGIIATLLYPLFLNDLTWFICTGTGFCIIYFVTIISFKEALPDSKDTHVVMVTQSIEIGGLEKMLFFLSRDLVTDHNITTSVFCYDCQPDTNDLSARFSLPKIKVQKHSKGAGFSILNAIRLMLYCSKERVSILHAHDLGSLIYSAFAKLISPKTVKLVFTQHSFVHLAKCKRYTIYEKLFSKLADKICVVSEEVKLGYEKLGVCTKKISIIPNGVDFPTANPHLTLLKDQRRSELYKTLSSNNKTLLQSMSQKVWILYLARVYKGKGHAKAMKLWNELPKSYRENSCLLFVGPANSKTDEEHLKELIETSLSSKNIIYIDGTDQPEDWYTAANIFLSCSESEGMPLSPLEALGYGLPALLSNIPGHTMFKGIAQLYNLGEVQEGARHLSKLIDASLNDPEKLVEQSWSKTQKLRTAFATQRMTNAYAELYKDLLTTKKNYKGKLTAYQLVLKRVTAERTWFL